MICGARRIISGVKEAIRGARMVNVIMVIEWGIAAQKTGVLFGAIKVIVGVGEELQVWTVSRSAIGYSWAGDGWRSRDDL